MSDQETSLPQVVKELADQIRYQRWLGVTGFPIDPEIAPEIRRGRIPSEQVEQTAKRPTQPSSANLRSRTRVAPPSPALPAKPKLPPIQRVERTKEERQALLTELQNELSVDCPRCKLAKLGRNQVVFGEGAADAALMFIGEGPGADEDRLGRPFVGVAGQELTRIIFAMGFTREEVYIANIVKCRPPRNRVPEEDEVETCIAFVHRQVEIIQPKVIMLLGNTPLRNLLGLSTGITRSRGKWYEYRGIQVMPTFHPSYLLRNPSAKKNVWEDAQEVSRILERKTRNKKQVDHLVEEKGPI